MALGLATQGGLALPAPALAVGDRWTLLDIAPEDVDALIALREGADLRTTAFGELARAALATLTGQSELAGAWIRLAAQLDLSPEQAFDALLGEEAMYALRLSDERPGAFDWAFVSVTSDETAARLERALGSAPRDIVERHVVRSIEQGRYWLVRTPLDGVSRLILAPARITPLLRSLLKGDKGRRQRRDRDGFAESKEWRLLRARGAEDGRLVAFARVGEQSWLGAAASWRDGALLIRAMAHGAPAPPPEPAPNGLLRFADDAILFAAERSSPVRGPGGYSIGAPIRALLVDDLFRDDAAAQGLLTGERVVWVSLGDDGSPLLAMALAVQDLAKIATVGDAVMAHVAARALEQASEKSDAMRLDFGGLYPTSLRAIPIHAPAAWGLPKRDATLAWGYIPAGPADEQRARQREPQRGWWVIGLSEKSAQALSRSLASTAEANQAAAGREPLAPWIASGVAKPAQLVRLWNALAPQREAPPLIKPFALIRRVAWRGLRISPEETLLTIEAHFHDGDRPADKR